MTAACVDVGLDCVVLCMWNASVLCPSSLHYKPPVNSDFAKDVAQRFGRQMLRAPIQVAHTRWSRYEAETVSSKLNCLTILRTTESCTSRKPFKRRLDDAMIRSEHDSQQNEFSYTQDQQQQKKRWLHNLSDRCLTTTEVN